MKLHVNGKDVEVNADEDTPLLWALRDDLGLTATKYGCGIAQCGVCSVMINNFAIRSCITPLSDVVGQKITTTEGLDNAVVKAVRDAWTKLNVVQCGYCQPAQIVSATALLYSVRKPTDDDIDQAMAGVACRCGTYSRIKAAIHLAAKALEDL
ncbi:MAG TPA: (2Fe-2S)-binding protein [Magnetospirillaceae bacterium]|jgi:isoquinoline 1-oxidoreductase alpha subunit